MAESKAILSSESGAAPKVALLLLCALVAVQIVAGLRVLWKPSGKEAAAIPQASAVAPAPAPLATTASPAGSSIPPLVIPPLPSFATPGSPSAPVTFGNPVPPASSAARIVTPIPTPAPPPSMPTTANSLPAPTASTSRTGNAQVDELVDIASQSRALGDHDGALEALNRADLLLPGNATVMREKALTLQRLGQNDKAQALWSRATPASPAAEPSAIPAPAPITALRSPAEMLNHAFGSTPAPAAPAAQTPPRPGSPLSLGQCQIVRDPTVIRGERLSLKVPLNVAPGAVIDPLQMTLDVFFYDRVNGKAIETTVADQVVTKYDTAGDFKHSQEVFSVLYNMPELTQAQVANLGRREFFGYVVRLYYQNKLMGTAADPPELIKMGEPGTGSSGAGHPLLPGLKN